MAASAASAGTKERPPPPARMAAVITWLPPLAKVTAVISCLLPILRCCYHSAPTAAVTWLLLLPPWIQMPALTLVKALLMPYHLHHSSLLERGGDSTMSILWWICLPSGLGLCCHPHDLCLATAATLTGSNMCSCQHLYAALQPLISTRMQRHHLLDTLAWPSLWLLLYSLWQAWCV